MTLELVLYPSQNHTLLWNFYRGCGRKTVLEDSDGIKIATYVCETQISLKSPWKTSAVRIGLWWAWETFKNFWTGCKFHASHRFKFCINSVSQEKHLYWNQQQQKTCCDTHGDIIVQVLPLTCLLAKTTALRWRKVHLVNLIHLKVVIQDLEKLLNVGHVSRLQLGPNWYI